LEINFVINGSGINVIDNTSYVMKKDDLFIINNLSHHMSLSNNSLEMKIITFNPNLIFINDIRDIEYLKSFYKKLSSLNNKIILSENNKEIVLALFIRMEREYKEKNIGYKLFIRAQLMELLAIIYREFKANEYSGSISKEQANYEKIRPSIEYINQNLNIDLILEDIASKSNMSKNYFCTAFKNVMQMTTIHYINLIRINRTCLLLRTSVKSILDISLDCGYNNLTSFNAAFKKICNETPRSYRKNNKENN
jgi:AraC-like DNA-binding protein